MLNRIGLQNPLKRWTKALSRAREMSVDELRTLHRDLRRTRADLDGLAAEAEAEILTRAGGPDGIVRPDQCDWAERPGPWQVPMRPRGHVDFTSPLDLGGGVTLFHDGDAADLSLRQEPARDTGAGARFGLVLEVYRFDGSFVSLVQDLPEAGLSGLTLNHYVAVQLEISWERPIEVYARLNVQHGPNTEQLVRQFAFDGDRRTAEFDLAYSKINERRIEKAWLDLILEGPRMNRVAIRDMVLLRAPRADI